MKAYELLDTKEKRCKGALAKTKTGATTCPKSEDACQWCAAGAIMKCYSMEQYDKMRDRVVERLEHWHGSAFLSLSVFNDLSDYGIIRQLLIEADV